ncbi:MAG: Ig-like domain-containing protein [Rickettsiales bacterium]
MAKYDNIETTKAQAAESSNVAVDRLSAAELKDLQKQLLPGDKLPLVSGDVQWVRLDLDFSRTLEKPTEADIAAASNVELIMKVKGTNSGHFVFPQHGNVQAAKITQGSSEIAYKITGKGTDIIQLLKSADFISPSDGSENVQFHTTINAGGQALAQGFFVLNLELTADGDENASFQTVNSSGRAQLPDLPEDEPTSENFDRPTFTTSDTLPFDRIEAGAFGDINHPPHGTDDPTPTPNDANSENDAVRTPEDTPITIDVLANDVDPDGDKLHISAIVTNPEHGTVKVVQGQVLYTPNKDYVGPDSFIYEVSDGKGGKDTATVTIEVTPVNDPPIANPDAATTDEDTPITIDVLTNDSDPDGDHLIIDSIVTQPTHGTVTIAPDGKTITYTPNKDYNGPDELTYKVSDGHGGFDEAKVTIDVLPINDPPIANDDAVITDEDTPIDIDVLTNDTDIDGDPLVIDSIVTGPQHGTITVSPDGKTLHYTPDLNYNGPDSLVYKISDGHGGFDEATVDITVRPVNDGPTGGNNGNAITDEDVPITIDLSQTYKDPDSGDVASIGEVTIQPAHGTAVLQPDGRILYTPDPNYNGPDKFWVKVVDGHGGEFVDDVNVDVLPVNDPPIALDDNATTQEETPVTVDVLKNDSDPVEGTPVILDAIVTPPSHGTAQIVDGKIVYTPIDNFNGTDTITYRIVDTDVDPRSATATLTVNVGGVNDGPAAKDDAATTNEDVPVTVDVLANDTDPDGDALTVTSIPTAPAHGTAEVVNGKIVYTPNPNYHGNDTLVYQISDGNGGTDTAKVTLTVNPTNDAPDARDDSATTKEDAPVSVDVLANDVDPDGDVLTVSEIVATPQHGTAQIVNGKILYTPNENYHGQDTLQYRASDPSGASDVATVTINIASANDKPDAKDDLAATDEDTPVTVDVLANDVDPDGDVLTLTGVQTAPAHGTAQIVDGKIVYTPNADYHGQDTFIYAIRDADGLTDAAKVTVTVNPANDAPDAKDDVATTDEDTPVSINVLANDTDPDGDVLTIEKILSDPSHGTAKIENGQIVYTPNANYNGADMLTYKISDGHGGTDTANVTITVGSENDKPNAVDDSAVTNEDTPISVDVLANDSDPEGDALTIDSILTGPQHGKAEIVNGEILYTPKPDYNGIDELTYRVSDGKGGFDDAKVTINVLPINDAPRGGDAPVIYIDESATITIDVNKNYFDPDGDKMFVSELVSDGAHGHVTFSQDGLFVTYKADANYSGADEFWVKVADGKGGEFVDNVSIFIEETPDLAK